MYVICVCVPVQFTTQNAYIWKIYVSECMQCMFAHLTLHRAYVYDSVYDLKNRSLALSTLFNLNQETRLPIIPGSMDDATLAIFLSIGLWEDSRCMGKVVSGAFPAVTIVQHVIFFNSFLTSSGINT